MKSETIQHSNLGITLRLLSFVEEEFDTDDITEQQFEGKYPPLSLFFDPQPSSVAPDDDGDNEETASSALSEPELKNSPGEDNNKNVGVSQRGRRTKALTPNMKEFYRTLFPSGRSSEHLGGFCFDFNGKGWCYAKTSEVVPLTMDSVQFMSEWIHVLKTVLQWREPNTQQFDFEIHGEGFTLVVDCQKPACDSYGSEIEGTIEFRHLGHMRMREDDDSWMTEDEFDPDFNPGPKTARLEQFVSQMIHELSMFHQMIKTCTSCGVLKHGTKNQIDHLNEEFLEDIADILQ